ncbi:hypothetical protein [Marinifilum fragile]|uniref:hypothetical protein n=1 Tax=Marinifilum fragile TaxID=570161 RepID=UPI002AA90676|nr:hypothetical protein [Marinifilum fragile]
MSKFKIEIEKGQTMDIKQGIGELKEGYNQGGDYSRISAYQGRNIGVHTGSKSDTVGRHNTPFGKEK